MQGLSVSSLLFGGSVPQRNATTEGLRMGCVAAVAHFASLTNADETTCIGNGVLMRLISAMSVLSFAQSAPFRTSHRTSSSLLFAAATARGVSLLMPFCRLTSLCAPFLYNHLHTSRLSAKAATYIGNHPVYRRLFAPDRSHLLVVDAPFDRRY